MAPFITSSVSALPVEVEDENGWQLPNISLADAVPFLLTLAALVLQVGLLVVVVEEVLQRWSS